MFCDLETGTGDPRGSDMQKTNEWYQRVDLIDMCPSVEETFR